VTNDYYDAVVAEVFRLGGRMYLVSRQRVEMCEGNPAARVTATFHHAKRGSYRYRVLDSIVLGAAA
jgi:hypothetical protein